MIKKYRLVVGCVFAFFFPYWFELFEERALKWIYNEEKDGDGGMVANF